ncbi:hypothetical protein N9F36_09120, partial [Akkermansiaceae bacterium]|nr:hypothetical protein [Akkermansiaceae bacterium]
TTKGVGQGDDEKKGQSGPAVQSGRGINSLEYAEYLRRIAEIEALKKPIKSSPRSKPNSPRSSIRLS